MSLPPDLVEMLTAFAAEEVRYLVVGGHAVSLLARPRSTKDLDIWLDADPDNIERALRFAASASRPSLSQSSELRGRTKSFGWVERPPVLI